jgi:hypothetical protein
VAVRIEVSGSKARCPYCHGDVASSESTVVCQDCLARHHAECWKAKGNCSSCRSPNRLVVETGGSLVRYRAFRGAISSWTRVCDQAAAFASEIRREDLVSISHSVEGEAVVTVWFRGEVPAD